MTDDELKAKIADIQYWYHAIPLRPGITTPGWAPQHPDMYGIPDKMSGEAVLDVGAWDGYWSFEALKRGANHVLAIDDFSDTCGSLVNASRVMAWASFDLCRRALGYSEAVCQRRSDSIERHACVYGMVDRVFMFGVLYHLKNPVLALQNAFHSLKRGGVIHVETAILDNVRSGYSGDVPPAGACYAEFFPRDEFGKNESNWWVPTLRCAAAWLDAVGFMDIESWKLTERPENLSQCRGFLRAKKP